MSAVDFTTTKDELALIDEIAVRAEAALGLDVLNTQMDLAAANANGCPLDLRRLADADEFDFAHDVLGIFTHIDRETGRVEGCFAPRCAKPSEPTS